MNKQDAVLKELYELVSSFFQSRRAPLDKAWAEYMEEPEGQGVPAITYNEALKRIKVLVERNEERKRDYEDICHKYNSLYVKHRNTLEWNTNIYNKLDKIGTLCTNKSLVCGCDKCNTIRIERIREILK